MIETVYLLIAESPDGYIAHKIGITSKSAEQRVKTLQTGNANKISILRHYKTRNARKIESMLHKRFRTLTDSKNEWRQLTDEQVFSFISICEELDDMIEFLLEHNSLYK